jgi:hypothetical protein
VYPHRLFTRIVAGITKYIPVCSELLLPEGIVRNGISRDSGSVYSISTLLIAHYRRNKEIEPREKETILAISAHDSPIETEPC